MKEYVTKKQVFETETEDYCHGGAGIANRYVSEEAYESMEWETIRINHDYGNASAGTIPLEFMEDAIAKIKEMGGNHIAIEYHVDHGSYLIDGFEYRTSTEEEIAEVLGKEATNKRKNLLERQANLKRELEEIEAGLNSKSN